MTTSPRITIRITKTFPSILETKPTFSSAIGTKLRCILKVKLEQQQVGPFEITRKIEQQAYELRLPTDWKIHPVVSIVQLEPFREDPFERQQPPPVPVTIEGEEYFKVEKVIRAGMRGRGRN